VHWIQNKTGICNMNETCEGNIKVAWRRRTNLERVVQPCAKGRKFNSQAQPWSWIERWSTYKDEKGKKKKKSSNHEYSDFDVFMSLG